MTKTGTRASQKRTGIDFKETSCNIEPRATYRLSSCRKEALPDESDEVMMAAVAAVRAMEQAAGNGDEAFPCPTL